jgi:hypothetical protein
VNHPVLELDAESEPSALDVNGITMSGRVCIELLVSVNERVPNFGNASYKMTMIFFIAYGN